MAPILRNEEYDDSRPDITPERVFSRNGTVRRSNYKQSWTGQNYRILYGKFRGVLLTDITSEKWLVWALNQFEGQLSHELYRALIDQFNSLHR